MSTLTASRASASTQAALVRHTLSVTASQAQPRQTRAASRPRFLTVLLRALSCFAA